MVSLVHRNPLCVITILKLYGHVLTFLKILSIVNTCTEVLTTKRYHIISQIPTFVGDHDLRSKTGAGGERWGRVGGGVGERGFCIRHY